jgi:hypothetical protein
MQDSSSLPQFVSSSSVWKQSLKQSRSLKKGSASSQLGLRLADCEQSDRSVRALTEPSYGEPAIRGEVKWTPALVRG